MSRIRILSPEGEIVRVLATGPLSPTEIVGRVKVSRAAVYNNIKDLLIAGWIIEKEGKYALTPEGVMAYLSEVLPDDVDVDRLAGLARVVGVSPMRLVSLGIRLALDIIENGELPESLGYMLSRYDPSVLDELVSMLERKEEVVA